MENMEQVFLQFIKSQIKAHLPKEYQNIKISLQELGNKPVLEIEQNHVKRRIPLEQAYSDYQSGKDIFLILEELSFVIRDLSPKMKDFLESDIKKWDMVKGRLYVQVCDSKREHEFLKNVPHTPHGDFSYIYKIFIEDDGSHLKTTTVTAEMCKAWGITLEELHQAAITPTSSVNHPVFFLVTEKLFQEEPKNYFYETEIPKQHRDFMYVLSSENLIHGAGMIAQPEVLKKIQNLLGENYYILPSSIHEVLIVPESTGDIIELSQTVYSINRTQIKGEDFLSDSVQYYDEKIKDYVNAIEFKEKEILKTKFQDASEQMLHSQKKKAQHKK